MDKVSFSFKGTPTLKVKGEKVDLAKAKDTFTINGKVVLGKNGQPIKGFQAKDGTFFQLKSKNGVNTITVRGTRAQLKNWDFKVRGGALTKTVFGQDKFVTDPKKATYQEAPVDYSFDPDKFDHKKFGLSPEDTLDVNDRGKGKKVDTRSFETAKKLREEEFKKLREEALKGLSGKDFSDMNDMLGSLSEFSSPEGLKARIQTLKNSQQRRNRDLTAKQLTALGVEKKSVNGDGDCFYHSIANSSAGKSKLHQLIQDNESLKDYRSDSVMVRHLVDRAVEQLEPVEKMIDERVKIFGQNADPAKARDLAIASLMNPNQQDEALCRKLAILRNIPQGGSDMGTLSEMRKKGYLIESAVGKTDGVKDRWGGEAQIPLLAASLGVPIIVVNPGKYGDKPVRFDENGIGKTVPDGYKAKPNEIVLVHNGSDHWEFAEPIKKK